MVGCKKEKTSNKRMRNKSARMKKTNKKTNKRRFGESKAGTSSVSFVAVIETENLTLSLNKNGKASGI